ncbi:hypothetical protein ABFA07_005415 [Porites harrisoni]
MFEMTTEVSKTTPFEARNDENIYSTTSTKQHPIVSHELKKCFTRNIPNLRELRVIVTKLDAASMMVAPLPGGGGYSVQPPSATINPLNKTLVPGVGNCPARKSKRSADALTCCLGCMAGDPCKRTKSGTQGGRKCGRPKNVGLKRKYVRRSTTAAKRQSDVWFGSRSNPSMVHQYRFDPQRRFGDVPSSLSAPLPVHLPVGMQLEQVCSTGETLPASSPVCSSTGEVSPSFSTASGGNSSTAASISTGFLAAAASSVVTNSRIAKFRRSHFPAFSANAAVSNPGVASIELSQFSSNPATTVANPGAAISHPSTFSSNPPVAVGNPGESSVQLLNSTPMTNTAFSSPALPSVQLSLFPSKTSATISHPQVASAQFSHPAANTTTEISNPGVKSLQQSLFPSLPPLPLRQPYITAIPVYADSCLLPVNVPYVQMQTQHGSYSVNTSTAGSNLAEGQVSHGASVGSQKDNVTACNDASVEYTERSSIGSAVLQKDCVGSNSTNGGHHRYNISVGTNSASSSTIGTQPQSDSENLFSISSLLPEMPNESASTLQCSMPLGGKKTDLKTVINLVTTTDVDDFRWLTNDPVNCRNSFDIPKLKKFICLEEMRLKCKKGQMVRSCEKLQQSIGTFQENISRDTKKYDMIKKKLHADTSQKRSVKQVETELQELLTETKVLRDGLDELETKWFRKEGTQLKRFL